MGAAEADRRDRVNPFVGLIDSRGHQAGAQMQQQRRRKSLIEIYAARLRGNPHRIPAPQRPGNDVDVGVILPVQRPEAGQLGFRTQLVVALQ